MARNTPTSRRAASSAAPASRRAGQRRRPKARALLRRSASSAAPSRTARPSRSRRHIRRDCALKRPFATATWSPRSAPCCRCPTQRSSGRRLGYPGRRQVCPRLDGVYVRDGGTAVGSGPGSAPAMPFFPGSRLPDTSRLRSQGLMAARSVAARSWPVRKIWVTFPVMVARSACSGGRSTASACSRRTWPTSPSA
jgi:hypothetical protein